MKWLGAFIIIALSWILGNLMAGEEKKKITALDSLISLLKYTRRRISAERTPLYKVFSSFEDEFLESAGFLPLLRSHRNSIPDSWCRATEILLLDSQTEKELLHLGEEMGALPLEQQEKRIDACIDMLICERDALKTALPARQKTLKTICLLGGLLLAILLL